MIDARTDLLRLIGNVEKDLRENPDPRPAQLTALRAALVTFDATVRGAPSSAYESSTRSGKHRGGKKKTLFRSLVGDIIDKNGGLVHRAEILRYLQARDFFAGHAHNHERSMSKYLSLDETFAPAGDGNWRRRPKGDPSNEIRPQGANPAA